MSTGAGKWQAAKVAVAAQNVSRQFHTLRDMNTDVGVPFDKLEYAGVLGEGAFGAVERRRYTDKEGHKAYYAVKRLKKQDVLLEGDETSQAARALVKMCSLAARSAVSDETVAEALQEDDAGGGAGSDAARVAVQDDRMFMAEIGVMRRLSHPYIIRYLGCGVIKESQPDGAPPKHFIAVAQEICEGGSLSVTISRASTMQDKRLYSYEDALRWSTQCARALEYLHEAKPQVLHRDLKAENILLTERGRGGDVRVMDFGLMKLRKMANNGWREGETANYKMTGITGSFLYMAPEVVRCEAYNEKVDIFSLAIIIFELFSMCPLAKSATETGSADEFEQYASRVACGHRETVDASWPQALQDIITGAWAADPHHRLSAAQVLHMLLEAKPAIEKMEAECERAVTSTNAGGAGGCCVIS